MPNIKLNTLLVSSFTFFALLSSSSSLGQTKNYYIDIVKGLYISPRSAGLGASDLAINRNSTLISNPGTLGFETVDELCLSYNNYFQNSFSSSLLSYAGDLDKNSGVSFSLGYLYVPGIEKFEDTNMVVYDIKNLVLFSVSDIWGRVSYGRRSTLSKNFEVGYGAGLNLRRRRLDEVIGYGIGLDVGAKLHYKPKNVSIGLLAENVVRSITKWDEGYKEYSYPHLKASFAVVRNYPYIYGKIYLGYTSPDLLNNQAVNSHKVMNESTDSSYVEPSFEKISENPGLLFTEGKFGFEYTIMNTLALRLGYNESNFTFGAGISFFENRTSLDFAYINTDLSGAYTLSIAYLW